MKTDLSPVPSRSGARSLSRRPMGREAGGAGTDIHEAGFLQVPRAAPAEYLPVGIMLTVAVFLVGCGQSALMQISRDNARMQMENPVKEQQLASLNAQNAALSNDKKRLLAELDNENLSLSELSEKLSNYQNQLANLEADNALQKKRYRDLQRGLQKYQNEIQSMKARPASSDAAKRKQIEALRARLREDLKAGED